MPTTFPTEPSPAPAGPPPAPDGLVIVDKPAGWTSHDVVAKARRILRTRKIGHAGTLDPMATGVLVLGVGRATKLLGHLALTDKEYEAVIRLGVTTVTDDAEGEVVEERPVDAAADALAAAIGRLTGQIDQVPSSVSAVKIDGKRAYARVRSGEEVKLAPRRVTVSAFELGERRDRGTGAPDTAGADLAVRVACSSGTYIRALARDLGADLGCGGHLTYLRRTRVGPFQVVDALDLDAFAERAAEAVTPLAAAVASAFPIRRVDADEADAVAHGRRLPAAGLQGPYGVVAADGTALALAEDHGRESRYLVVFAPAG
ncbi:tRNA pseudouridine(55) synthase TruB [Frankia sp. AgB1.9]|uniref:tRNA pseudouridine(55) synthase TruB n=1 Tax=unclassified Frankia TaxID=2632575 RepID=UPI001932973B|nr:MULTISPECIES: tRNA pseudouridine(55) synthase TruB [unclassified Frankia]MBL7488981.1 tRNA pseudouridine(55) synthase TruB [Frankia sp. AgW1.1]MBL7546849.1 tRNA pseudouridine(55) synthase TruB [Frankia sp. AgB1.9]MBL7622519.1 tRNA pseudouridine(55) synthase TruB [Frankia sp. AgB1.8]